MGANCCCFSSGGSQGHRVVEERVPLSPNIGVPPTFSTGLLVDTNLETQTIETYRPPPPPIPYDVVQGHVHTPPTTQEICGDKNSAGSRREPESVESSTHSTTESTEKIEELKESQISIEIALTEKLEIKLSKSVDDAPFVIEEEDVCPTCLEEYDDENPKMMTKCDHHFHLSCILEWKERSETCPVCDQLNLTEWCPSQLSECLVLELKDSDSMESHTELS